MFLNSKSAAKISKNVQTAIFVKKFKIKIRTNIIEVTPITFFPHSNPHFSKTYNGTLHQNISPKCFVKKKII